MVKENKKQTKNDELTPEEMETLDELAIEYGYPHPNIVTGNMVVMLSNDKFTLLRDSATESVYSVELDKFTNSVLNPLA